MLLLKRERILNVHVSSLIDEDDSLLELSLEDFHCPFDVRSGIVEMILAENHPAGLRIPRVLLVVPGTIVLHGKREAHEFALVLVLFLVSEIAHRVHQRRGSQRVQLERKSVALTAARATRRIDGAPDHATDLASHKVGGNSRAVDFFHC